MNKNNFWTAENLSYLFFSLFLAGFTFPVRKVLYEHNSFLTGLFSEYLTIFFEVSELFLIGVFLFFAFNKPQIKSKQSFQWLILIFILSSLLSIFFAQEKTLAYLGFLKIMEAFLVGFFVFASNYPFKNLVRILFFVGLFQGLVGVFQFFIGSDIGLHFLGEQPLNILQAGSPKITIGEQVYLRAEGTFLHPNILACFLLVSFFLAGRVKTFEKNLRWLLLFPLVLTFSRTAFLALIVGLFLEHKNIRKLLIALAFIAGLAMIVPEVREILFSRLNLGDSLTERWDLCKISLMMLFSFPAGVGINNFLLNMPAMQTWLYQPVHNIFLLAANEAGIFAGIILIVIFILAFIKNKELRSVIMVLFIFGLFDHFLWSIQAGMMLLFIVLGLALRQEKKDSIKERIAKMVKKFMNN